MIFTIYTKLTMNNLNQRKLKSKCDLLLNEIKLLLALLLHFEPFYCFTKSLSFSTFQKLSQIEHVHKSTAEVRA